MCFPCVPRRVCPVSNWGLFREPVVGPWQRQAHHVSLVGSDRRSEGQRVPSDKTVRLRATGSESSPQMRSQRMSGIRWKRLECQCQSQTRPRQRRLGLASGSKRVGGRTCINLMLRWQGQQEMGSDVEDLQGPTVATAGGQPVTAGQVTCRPDLTARRRTSCSECGGRNP